MTVRKVLFLLCSVLLLASCATINVGDGPHATERDIHGEPVTRRDITFSVDFHDDYGPEAWFEKDEIIKAIREDFERSGMFGRVYLTDTNNISERHYHFSVYMTGTDANTRQILGTLSGFTLGAIPTWTSMNLDWSMSYIHKGKEAFAASSEQASRDVVWLPFIITSPVLNHATVGSGMKHNAIFHFLREIRRNKLNEMP